MDKKSASNSRGGSHRGGNSRGRGGRGRGRGSYRNNRGNDPNFDPYECKIGNGMDNTNNEVQQIVQTMKHVIKNKPEEKAKLFKALQEELKDEVDNFYQEENAAQKNRNTFQYREGGGRGRGKWRGKGGDGQQRVYQVKSAGGQSQDVHRKVHNQRKSHDNAFKPKHDANSDLYNNLAESSNTRLGNHEYAHSYKFDNNAGKNIDKSEYYIEGYESRRKAQNSGGRGGKKENYQYKKKNERDDRNGRGQQHNRKEKSRNANFDKYVEDSVAVQGLDNGKYFKGVIRINPFRTSVAYVSIEGIENDIMIDCLKDQNRALEGATVVIAIRSPNAWPEMKNLKVAEQKMDENIIAETSSQEDNDLEVKEESSSSDDEEEKKEEVKKPKIKTKNEGKKNTHKKIDHKKLAHHIIKEEEDSEEDLVSPGIKGKRSTSKAQINAKHTSTSEKEEYETVSEEDVNSDNVDANNYLSKGEDIEEKAVLKSKKDIESLNLKKTVSMVHEEEQKKKKVVSSEDVELKRFESGTSGHEGDVESEIERAGEKGSGDEENKKKSYWGKGKKKEKKTNASNDDKPKKESLVELHVFETRESVVKHINSLSKLRPLGYVVAILNNPNWTKKHLSVLHMNTKDMGSKTNVFAIPINKRLPKIMLRIEEMPAEFQSDIRSNKNPGSRYYEVGFDEWNYRYFIPFGKISKHVGEAGDIDVETLRLIKHHELCEMEYSSLALEDIKKFDKGDDTTKEWQIPDEEITKRLDIRHKRIFTIDPITAKDLDDALSIDKISDTVYEVGVHIADVSYFVEEGTQLDVEARLRATSVYFVHEVLPMLPRLLCERLCSLNPAVDRLAYSVFFRLNVDGTLVKEFTPIFKRTVIRSCAKWNYELVQDILDGIITKVDQLDPAYVPEKFKFEELVEDCFRFNTIAQNRRKIRFDNGSILLDKKEFVFVLNEADRMPLQYIEQKKIPSKALIEEYMLLANQLVAEQTVKYAKGNAILRRHPSLKEDEKVTVVEYFKQNEIEFDITSSLTVQESFNKLKSTDLIKYFAAMRKLLTALDQARYFAVGDSEPDHWRHYALNFDTYTHFTSPIRRYADLLVHRVLTICLENGEKAEEILKGTALDEMANECSDKSMAAKRASDDCQKLFHCLYLKKQGFVKKPAYLIDIDEHNLALYFADINMGYKMRLMDEEEISKHVFVKFRNEMLIIFDERKGKKLKEEKKQNERQSKQETKMIYRKKEAPKQEENTTEKEEIKEPVDTEKEKKETVDFRTITDEASYQLVIDQIESSPYLKKRFLKLKMLDTIDLLIRTTDTIPISLCCKFMIEGIDEAITNKV